MQLLNTVFSFALALAILIAVHEWGHYRMAVACGVKVLRFSIGFGKTLLRFKPRRQHPGQDTEFAIAAIPLGGYVKMLDEREGPVPPEQRHRAFNTQPLASRALIVAAGPAANLVLAVALYALLSWIGMQEPRAVLSAPPAQSLAAQAGLQAGDVVQGVQRADGGKSAVVIHSFETLRWELTQAGVDGQDVRLHVLRGAGHAQPHEVLLPLSRLQTREPDAGMFRAIGIVSPLRAAQVGKVAEGSPAERAGLQTGDVVLQAAGQPVADAAQLRESIRQSGQSGEPGLQAWQIRRGGRVLDVTVQPRRVPQQGGTFIGQIGAELGAPPEMVTVRRGPIEGLQYGAKRVWDMTALTLRMMGRMLLGELSLKHLSGPIAIADYAGQAMSLGLPYFIELMAFVSLSLGVLNLMPVPVLDGGHLMYYLWEAATGKPVSGAWLQRLQYVGLGLLLTMMAIAMFNDISARLG